MTVDTTAGSGSEVEPYEFDDAVGLEDIGVTDVVIPRLQIVHADGVFMDNLSKNVYPSLKVILLGMVKQRIMWDDKIDEGDRPQCKSTDFINGFPQMRDDIPKRKQFPWERSNFSPENFKPEDGLNNMVTLPCGSCIFKDWDKGDWKTPPCNEQHTYPLLYSPDGDPENLIPALFTTQRTGIKPSRTYISSFAQTKTPLFTVFTELTLTQQSRGINKYSVPNFKRLEQTDRGGWSEYANQLRSIREFIRQPPRSPKDDEPTSDAPAEVAEAATAEVSAASSSAPVPADTTAQGATAEQAGEVKPPADDDLPF